MNLFLNYTIKNGLLFNNSKIALSFNNLLNSHDVVGVIPAASPVPAILADGAPSPYIATTAIDGGDQLTQTPGRSVMVTFTFGYTGKR